MDVRAELKIMEGQPGWKTQTKGIFTLRSSSTARDDFFIGKSTAILG